MTGRVIDVVIDETGLPTPSHETDQERRIAIFDLIEDGRMSLVAGSEGPYRLRLRLDGRRILLAIAPVDGDPAEVALSLDAFEQSVREYAAFCASYAEAVRTLPPARIEAADNARRRLHLEAAMRLRLRLAGRVEIDEATARRLFTLICAMLVRD